LLAFNPPSDLTAAPIAATKIRLRWLDNSANESGFRLERSPDGTGNWTAIALRTGTAGSGSTVQFVDEGRTAGVRYWYRVRAYVGNGTAAGSVFSPFSNVADAAIYLPEAPASLTAEALSSTRIRLRWVDNASGENGFRLERSPDGSTGWATIALRAPATGAGSTVEYVDPNCGAGTTYWYRLRAYVGDGTTAGSVLSAFSNTASATTP
jgi:large repetitive protein